MRGKPKENIDQTVKTAGKAVATGEKATATTYDVKPTETVSIVADNRTIFLGKGIVHITVE